MIRIWSLMVLLVLNVSVAWAVPTQQHSRLIWTPSVSADASGNFLYWAREVETIPRLYDDTRRVDLGVLTLNLAGDKEVIVIDAKPDAEASLCFKVTAYDASNNESGFSNEVCGFFGLQFPLNLRTTQ